MIFAATKSASFSGVYITPSAFPSLTLENRCVRRASPTDVTPFIREVVLTKRSRRGERVRARLAPVRHPHGQGIVAAGPIPPGRGVPPPTGPVSPAERRAQAPHAQTPRSSDR